MVWWNELPDNDQTAHQHRDAGIVTLYPSLRGGAVSPLGGGVRPYAFDQSHADALWAKAADLVGERF
ncbi:hypothetical protein [Aureimonas leprariae]|uniref:Uncharacterized protein n=1 Tax=Plantimonas leprariae TaxID=2615207 RepID=A0A7V7PLL0_9HYPH|nr:hypothetical protein [Aureimonas leprariae]KAB0677246.1 hypothetical protein F6X38_19220 [Aureimonas leprariae]